MPPGSALPPEMARPFEWAAVGSGMLGLELEGEELPPGWQFGEERSFHHGQSLPSVPPETRMTFRNAGDDPLVLYRLTITPD